MKKSMTKKISLACIALLCANTLYAQYSNATLNGPWLLHNGPFTIANAEADTSFTYICFDGGGNITDWENFGPVGGTDSVTASGAVSVTLIIRSVNGSVEDTVRFPAQLSSQDYASMGPGAGLSRILNPGALTDSLVGEVSSPIAGGLSVLLLLNSQGQIISSTGLVAPVSGRVYADSGIFMGHIKTGDATMYTADSLGSSWDEFTIIGSYANDSLNGVVYLDGPKDHSPVGTVHLVRKGIATVTEILPTKTGGVPGSFALSQNYPNPFNPATAIDYQLPTNSMVFLKVYDVLGREVKTLVSERQAAGRHTVNFNAGSLPSGVYFYALQAGNFSETKKFVLLK